MSSSCKNNKSILFLTFLPNFFGLVSIWAGFTIGRNNDGENAEVLQAMYFATGFICMSLFCIASLILALVRQGQSKANI